MLKNIRRIITIITLNLIICSVPSFGQIPIKTFDPAIDSISSLLNERAEIGYKLKIQKIKIRKKTIEIYCNKAISDSPIRKSDIKKIEKEFKIRLPKKYKPYRIKVLSSDTSLDDLYSKFYAGEKPSEDFEPHNSPWVIHDSPLYSPSKGLENMNIALWPSHGYYYNHKLKTWKWQRAPYFSTIEDLYTQDFVVPYLAPMLENAGAYVMMPRERDYQTHEIIIDDGSPYYKENIGGIKQRKHWTYTSKNGWGRIDTIYSSGVNPFTAGKARMVKLSKKQPASAEYRPKFPENGDYAVYVSYQSLHHSVKNARYKVIHSGGEDEFIVDQTMGGGTWVYLGTFPFSKGLSDQGVVVYAEMDASSTSDNILTTDAVRFGGGMGRVARDSILSNFPKYAEAARYWLQYSGFPDTVYNQNKDENDYNDDFTSRGEWVNSLTRDFNVPVDLAFALHSDAGKTMKDSTVGTLAIYTRDNKGKLVYNNGKDRIISREFADIVQTEIVKDIRNNFDKDWSRRGTRDRSYFETRVPEVPAVIIELLSHQNFEDMKIGLDPKFKFTVSRSIYKGILKFISHIYGLNYVIQPLPVQTFSATLEKGDRPKVILKWTHAPEKGEPTSEADKYIVYTRKCVIDDKNDEPCSFDNGIIVRKEYCEIPVEPGIIYSFKVVAVNEGGISFPSEILSAAYVPDSKEILIVNNFNRVSAPESFITSDSLYAGFKFFEDSGVPYIANHAFTGIQYNFKYEDDWISDDNPGLGASYTDYGPDKVAGNTFDYPYIHGKAMLKSGYSFSSCSINALTADRMNLDGYFALDIIGGKNKKDILPSPAHKKIEKFCNDGGNIILSGAYIGENFSCTHKEFADNVMRFSWSHHYSSSSGEAAFVSGNNSSENKVRFHIRPNPEKYCIESVDALLPDEENGYTFMRYTDSSTSAAVIYSGETYKTVVFGFPIETITSQQQIDELLREVMLLIDSK